MPGQSAERTFLLNVSEAQEIVARAAKGTSLFDDFERLSGHRAESVKLVIEYLGVAE